MRRFRNYPEEVAKRVPPGNRLVKGWPVLHYGPVPKFDEATWDFTVSGLVEHPFTVSYAELKALGPVTVQADMHCVTGWTTLDNHWEGVPFRVLGKKERHEGKLSPRAGRIPYPNNAEVGTRNAERAREASFAFRVPRSDLQGHPMAVLELLAAAAGARVVAPLAGVGYCCTMQQRALGRQVRGPKRAAGSLGCGGVSTSRRFV